MSPGKVVGPCFEEMVDDIARSHKEHILDYGLGHGIGLSPEESPLFRDDDPTLLEEGMCLALRLAVREGELGPVMTGDTLLLSEDGRDVLTQ